MHAEDIQKLRNNWGNTDYTASQEYIEKILEIIDGLGPESVILECGSGLTSFIIDKYATTLGHTFRAVEHSREWHENLLGRDPAAMEYAYYTPLEDYGSYMWYSCDEILPESIHLVVCDGPPGGTKGNRYGALPQLWSHLTDDFTLILDDAQRTGEQAVLSLWKMHFPIKFSVFECSDGRSYAIVTRK